MFSKKRDEGVTADTQVAVIRDHKKVVIVGAVLLFVGGLVIGAIAMQLWGPVSDKKAEARFTAMVTTENNQEALSRLYEKVYEKNGTNDLLKGPVSKEDRKKQLEANYDELKESVDTNKDASIIAVINVATTAAQLGNTADRDAYIAKAEARLGELDKITREMAEKYIQEARNTKPI